MHWSVYTALEVLWIFFLAAWIILERRSPAATVAWILALAFLPLLGAPVYFFLGPRRLRRKHYRRALARKTVAAWTGGRQLAYLELPSLLERRHQRIATVGIRAGEAPPMPAGEVRLLFDGDECFGALLEAIAAARHHVHLEYYIVRPGVWQERLFRALVEKARAGVEVRLLMDAFGSKQIRPRHRRLLREAGVEVAFFNSIRLARMKPRLANFRTHRKIVVVDGRIGFTGGMNIMDEQSRAVSGAGAWRDTHLKLKGDATIPLQLVFLEDWHYATGSGPEGEEYFPRPRLAEGSTLVQVVASGPDCEIPAIHQAIFAAIAEAEERVWATTPYLVPDEPILAAFVGAALRGVDVRLLVPGRSDRFLAAAAARSYYPDLLRAGVRLFEYLPSMIHAKTMVVDGDLCIVGTANLDNRSFRLNFEVVALVFGREEADALADRFLRDLDDSREASPRPEHAWSVPRRLVEGTARFFSPIL